MIKKYTNDTTVPATVKCISHFLQSVLHQWAHYVSTLDIVIEQDFVFS